MPWAARGDPSRTRAVTVPASEGIGRRSMPASGPRLPPGASDPRPVGGGDINEAYRVTLADGREAFVKTRREPISREYAAEAVGPSLGPGTGPGTTSPGVRHAESVPSP